MPRAEENTNPRGLPPGAIEEANALAAVAPDQSPAAGFEGGAPAVPLESPVNQPAITPEQPWKPPAPEGEVPNIDPENGMNYDEILLGGSQRPQEPVTAGIPGVQGPKVSEILTGLSQQSDSPDIKALLRNAQMLGM